MLGQLQDAGNTVTVAHYLDLLDKAGMLCGIQKYDAKEARRRKSSPRFMVYDTSLMTASSGIEKSRYLGEPDLHGHLVESAVGARLLARASEEGLGVYCWREGTKEVDFVVSKGFDSPRSEKAAKKRVRAGWPISCLPIRVRSESLLAARRLAHAASRTSSKMRWNCSISLSFCRCLLRRNRLVYQKGRFRISGIGLCCCWTKLREAS